MAFYFDSGYMPCHTETIVSPIILTRLHAAALPLSWIWSAPLSPRPLLFDVVSAGYTVTVIGTLLFDAQDDIFTI